MTTEGRLGGVGPSDCPRCGTAFAVGERFCTSCGLRLVGTGVDPATGDADVSREAGGRPGAAIVACARCAAPNAASRRRCGRCGADLGTVVDGAVGTVADGAVGADGDADGPGPEALLPALDARGRPLQETTGLLLLVLVVAGLVTAGVLVALVTARAGLLGSTDAPPTTRAFGELTVAGVDGPASAERLIDGDATTAWRSDADEPVLVLDMGGSVLVRRLQVWNGDQAEGAFTATGRVATLRIEVGDRSFVVDLLDIPGPQIVDLPDDLELDALALVVEDVHAGDDERAPRVALSEVEVLGDELPRSSRSAPSGSDAPTQR